jgi:hypothetical protein
MRYIKLLSNKPVVIYFAYVNMLYGGFDLTLLYWPLFYIAYEAQVHVAACLTFDHKFIMRGC